MQATKGTNSTTRSLSRLARLNLQLVITALLISVLTMVAAPSSSSAQQVVDGVCVEGTFVNGSCQVRTTEVPECEPGSCAVEVDRPSRCLEPGDCPIVELADQAPDRCPDGARGEADSCFIYVPKGPDGCDDRSLLDNEGNCRQPVANARGAYSCPEGGQLAGRDCSYPGEPVYGFCPAGSEPANGACTDFAIDGLVANCGLLNEDFASMRCIEPAEVFASAADTCSADAQLILGQCVVAIPGIAVTLCTHITEPGNWFYDSDGRCQSFEEAVEATCPAAYSRSSQYAGDAEFPAPAACFRYEVLPELCAEGQVTPDGQSCAVLAQRERVCPDGFLPDSSLNNLCARFVPAEQSEPRCPDGARGEPDTCYILVAFGPRGEASCPEGTLAGSLCVIIGDPPIATTGECAVSSTVFLDGDFCYSILSRNPDGSCPANTDVEVDGECRIAAPIRPGPLACADPSFSLLDGQCIKYVAAETGPRTCPDGAVQVGDTECRQPVANRAGDYFCADPAAALNGRTCVFTAGFTETGEYVCAQGILTVYERIAARFCVIADAAEIECGDGVPGVAYRVCLFAAPFDALRCPALYTPFRQLSFCERFLPSRETYSCGVGNVLTTEAGIPQCWAPSGPQPGDCPGVTRDGQCFDFVAHRFVCEAGGCTTAVPPVDAAPIAERGDINCDNVRDIKDALVLATGLARADVARATACDDVVANGGLRVTAADLVGDGTVNTDDARRFLQCLVDDTLASCAN